MTPCCFVAPSPWRSGGVGSPFCVPWSNGPDVLIDAAWPGQAVEDSNLTVQIAALRRALGEATPGGDRWIETMPRHGYRFIGPVVAEETPSPPIVKPKRNKAQLEKRERSEHSRSRMTPSHFAAGSSLMSGLGPSAMSALPPKADMCGATRDVPYGPIAD